MKTNLMSQELTIQDIDPRKESWTQLPSLMAAASINIKLQKNSRQGIDLDGFTQNIGNKTRHSIEIHTSKMQSFVHGKGKHGRNLSKRNISN